MEQWYIDGYGFMMVDGDGMWLAVAAPCLECSEKTHRGDLTFMAPLHVDCSEIVWKEYCIALNKGAVEDPDGQL